MSSLLSNISFAFLLFGFAANSSAADGELRWAADAESGAPFVFHDPQAPTQLKGFEYDIVQLLAKKLNRKPVFVPNAWDGLILGVKSNLYDIAINGIEITDERKKEVLFSEPYYATFLQIIVRSGDQQFKNLSDLNGFKVGTLTGALSEKVLRAEPNIHVLTYESETLAHEDLLIARSDALLFDAPIAKYRSEIDSRFTILPAVVGSMTYGIVAAKKNVTLMKEINRALEEMKASGELREIYERWALWNGATATLFNDFSNARLKPVEFELFKEGLKIQRTFDDRLRVYRKAMPLMLKAALNTIRISFVAMALAVAVGLGLMALRRYGGAFFRSAAILFIELIRGTPLLLQLFFIFYGLPSLGLEISAFWAAVIGLGINYGVQESEIYRAGLESVHHHHLEAAHMLGLNRWQTFWSVQFPQAFRICLPPMTTDFIALIKDSSLVSVITLVELTKTYSMLSATYYDYVGFAIITAVIYLIIGLPLVALSRHLESQLKIRRV